MVSNKEVKEGKKFITKELMLGILKTGEILGLAVFAPNALQLFKNIGKKKPWSEYYPSSLERLTKRLYRRGFVEIKYKNGSPVVKISEKGKMEILEYDLDRMTIAKPKVWDGKWRIVMFDISEKYRKTRDVVRNKLQELGFYPFQESVFIYPYPCEKEIKYIREVLSVPHAIKWIRADRVENEQELRRIFNI